MSDDSRDGLSGPALHSRRCLVCGEYFETAGRGRYCSRACQQRAYRLRQMRSLEEQQETWMRELERRTALLLQSIYECPRCEQRLLFDRRCPDCNLMCRKVGLGGECPHCQELTLVTELIGIEAV